MCSMAMSYEDAVAVQRRHEGRLLRLPGVTAVGVKLRDGQPVLEVSVDPGVDVPAEVQVPDLDGLPLRVERQKYELQ
jgi:hypothetical protein